MTGKEVKEKINQLGIKLNMIADNMDITPQHLHKIFEVADIKLEISEVAECT